MKIKTILILLAFSSISYANGYTGPQNEVPIITVSKALTEPDDKYVALQGYIVNAINDEEYTFKDETGEITVEIDNKVWQGISVDDKTKVVIYGEVDTNMFSKSTIDVSKIVKI